MPLPASPEATWTRLSAEELEGYRKRLEIVQGRQMELEAMEPCDERAPVLRLECEMLRAALLSWTGWKARQYGFKVEGRFYIRLEDGVFVAGGTR